MVYMDAVAWNWARSLSALLYSMDPNRGLSEADWNAAHAKWICAINYEEEKGGDSSPDVDYPKVKVISENVNGHMGKVNDLDLFKIELCS